MARRTEQTLDRLAELRANPGTDEAVAELRKALGDRSSFVVAKAARIIGEGGLTQLAPDLAGAFQRFLEGNPAETDKGCEAKKAVCEALRAMERHAREVYLRGVRHIQREPVWGGSQDTAAELRACCALGLVDAHAPEALAEAVTLLADPELRARIGSVKALGSSGDPGAVLVLRYKALSGDREPEVTAECLLELLRMDRRGSFDFVAGFLNREQEPELAQAAALALGETREERALEVLQARLETIIDPAIRRTILLAIATLRLDAGFKLLADIVRQGRPRDGSAALDAFALYRQDEAVIGMAREALRQRSDRELDAAAARLRLC
jgi:HEAT repeat protein